MINQMKKMVSLIRKQESNHKKVMKLLKGMINMHNHALGLQGVDQWFSNFLHQVPPQKIFGFPSTTIMTNIKMQYKWLPTAPGVCSRCVCVCVCVCVCTLDGLNADHKF